MANEVVLVPKEKYQKLIENQEKTFNHAGKQDSSELNYDSGKKENNLKLKGVDKFSDAQIVGENSLISNQHFHKEINDLDKDREEVYLEKQTKAECEIDDDKFIDNQRLQRKNMNMRSYKFCESSNNLAVNRTTEKIVKRQKSSPKRRKMLSKKWLKYK